MAGKPSLLLLDEPFEMAGGEHAGKMSELILSLQHTTVIVVTGNRSFAQQCDQVIHLEKGRIKRIGTPAVVLNEIPTY